ncbi:invasion associated locus B family protein [Dongia sp. agr-C8]
MAIILKSLLAGFALSLAATASALGQEVAQDATAAAAAATPTAVGSFKSWSAYTFEDKGRLMCYTQSEPAGSIGKVESRGSAAVMVIQAPDAAARDQVSIVLGFLPQDGKNVTVTIGAKAGKGKKFTLKKFAVGRAWAESSGQDKQIVSAMKRYNYLVVDSISKKGEKVRDTYYLSGFGKAYDASVTACK